jgi:predicted nuclease of predicted toxin-antitoxin system
LLPPIVADVNIALPVVQWLRVHDVDVVYAIEERWFRMTDREMLLRASADSRFMLNHDSDFGKLAIQMGNRITA